MLAAVYHAFKSVVVFYHAFNNVAVLYHIFPFCFNPNNKKVRRGGYGGMLPREKNDTIWCILKSFLIKCSGKNSLKISVFIETMKKVASLLGRYGTLKQRKYDNAH